MMRYRRPSQYSRKEKNRRKKKIFFIVFFAFVLVVLLIWGLNQPFFRLKRIEIEGNETVLRQDIEGFLEAYFNEKILFLLPRDIVLFVSPRGVARRVENHFPRIYEAEAHIVDGNIFHLEVEEREPHSLWCRNQVYERVFDEECFFADQRGYIYSRAPYFSEGVFEKIYMEPSSLEIGKEVLDKKRFSDFFRFIRDLEEEHKMFFTQFVMTEEGTTRLYFSLFEGVLVEQKPFLIYYQSASYDVLKKEVALLREAKSFQEVFKKRPQDLEILDFRIPNQIRYTLTPQKELNNDDTTTKNTE